jgi:hypothetical protein
MGNLFEACGSVGGNLPGDGPHEPGKLAYVGNADNRRLLTAFHQRPIVNAVVMELQRTHGTKVKLTIEIEAEATEGFADSEVSVVHDSARQLRFKSESTGFDE